MSESKVIIGDNEVWTVINMGIKRDTNEVVELDIPSKDLKYERGVRILELLGYKNVTVKCKESAG